MRRSIPLLVVLPLILAILACEVGFTAPTPNPNGSNNNGGSSATAQPAPEGETAVVTYIVDGDTVEVEMNGIGYRVRYVGVNTPERDQDCYQEAKDANAALVEGETVTLVQDESNTDQYGRLLRYIYVGNTMINEELVREGYAEAVEYRPDTRYTSYFRQLEGEASAAGRGCHPTGIFDDGSQTR
jgi:endonuclease YncB( thermonuclease family)